VRRQELQHTIAAMVFPKALEAVIAAVQDGARDVQLADTNLDTSQIQALLAAVTYQDEPFTLEYVHDTVRSRVCPIC